MLSEEATNTHFIGKLGWHPTRSHLNKDKHINHYITEAENSTMVNLGLIDWLIDFAVFNAAFSTISAISWRPDLVVEEPGENHQPWASNW